MKIRFLSKITHPHVKRTFSTLVWFTVGFLFTGVVMLGILIFYFQQAYKDKVIPGVYVNSFSVGGMTKEELLNFFNSKNERIQTSNYVFKSEEGGDLPVSARDLGMGYDTNLITMQALELGKSDNIFSNMFIALSSYINGVHLTYDYSVNQEMLQKLFKDIALKINKEPIDAQFSIENERVTTFKESENGSSLDFEKLSMLIDESAKKIIETEKPQSVILETPIKILEPKITTEEANEFGIVEKIGEGKSEFKGSIPNRIYNISLAASRVTGILVEPDEEFSFNKNLGDVTRLTGYKEAYVIQNGRTVLGDGGGVCQVSTTLYRALLNAGLPITERHAHAYRVGYYEQNSPPGIDATIFYPRVDMKFKNDTGNHILIQNQFDETNQTLVYTLYGKKDNRTVEITEPVVLSRTPPPEALYQDDPTLPRGTTKQVDFAAGGAKVSFTRKVTKDNAVIIDETISTSYRPWQAVYLVGTKDS